jgi:short-subunit dehydrogenase
MPLRKNIVITGASSGLGEGLARSFAARGRNLALAARRLDRLEALADELRSAHGVRVVTRSVDVNDHAQVFSAFRDFRDELGTLDRVIVNAGINIGQSLGTGNFDSNRQTIETNLLGSLAQVEAAVEIFRDQNAGHLVVMSSLGAVRGMPGHLNAYNASKAGLSSLSTGLGVELQGSPIKITTLQPGYIESELNDVLQIDRPHVSTAEDGVKSLVRAIESETRKATVPRLPWQLISMLMRVLPEKRLTILT